MLAAHNVVAQESSLAVVEVGATKKKYHIHRALLMEHSEYFEKALNGPWKEAEAGVIILEDVKCTTFDFFVDWLYTGTLPKTADKWQHGQQPSGVRNGESMLVKTRALVFGDRFLAPAYGQAAQHALVAEIIKDGVWYDAVIFAFANLPCDHSILDLMVETQYRHFDEHQDGGIDGEVERRHRLPRDFLIRVMVRYSRSREYNWELDVLDPCD